MEYPSLTCGAIVARLLIVSFRVSNRDGPSQSEIGLDRTQGKRNRTQGKQDAGIGTEFVGIRIVFTATNTNRIGEKIMKRLTRIWCWIVGHNAVATGYHNSGVPQGRHNNESSWGEHTCLRCKHRFAWQYDN